MSEFLGPTGSAGSKVKISETDTTTDYLSEKLTAGTNVVFTQNNSGGDESITIAVPVAAPSGSAGGQLSGTYPNPSVVGLTETSGPTALAVGAIADGQLVKRVGTTLISVAMPATLPPSGSAGGQLSGTYPNPSVAGITETSGPTALTAGAITDGELVKRVGTTLTSIAMPTTLPPSGSAGGQLTGTYPNPSLESLAPAPTGTYTLANVTVDAHGRVTAATSSSSVPISVVSRYVSLDADDIAVFAFDEAYGSTTFANTGTEVGTLGKVAGTPYAGTPGIFNNSLQITTAARIESAAAKWQPASAITCCAWVFLRTFPSTVTTWRIFNKSYVYRTWAGPTYYSIDLSLYQPTGVVTYYIKTASTVITPSAAVPWQLLPLNQWSLLSLTYDGANARLYINGNQVDTAAGTGNIDYGSNGEWFIGANVSTGDAGSDYFLDDWRICKAARSASYLLDMYRRGANRMLYTISG